MLRPILICAAIALTGCAAKPSRPAYTGPEVTQIFVSKEHRKLYLLHGNDVLRSYDISLGFTPIGHKTAEGDGRTPEGLYLIDRRNERSAYHLSLGISYPNRMDLERSQALGVSPGGDIFIHGEDKGGKSRRKDWTAGCIAVTDEEMDEIYSMVRTGTPIYIKP